MKPFDALDLDRRPFPAAFLGQPSLDDLDAFLFGGSGVHVALGLVEELTLARDVDLELLAPGPEDEPLKLGVLGILSLDRRPELGVLPKSHRAFLHGNGDLRASLIEFATHAQRINAHLLKGFRQGKVFSYHERNSTMTS